ncbi:hypothetical protein EKG35_14865 [Lysinibacillus telephonicus]|uniref:DUF2269 family protein n=1 Tax=Lysinibacillus telephonicus TaxID=1714840 RepID=A0A3S0IZG9_9BACI|nr:hypothetical protein EKG35_14865 [Lysinibacillus telephonicus]
MRMVYTFFLYTHILSAIISIGPLFALLLILKKMDSLEESQLWGFVQLFQSIITIIKHAGHVLVISGIILIILSGWTWTTSWVVLTILVMLGSIIFLARAFKPTIHTFGTTDFNKEIFIIKLRKSTWLYIFLLLVMLWFMVAKPELW